MNRLLLLTLFFGYSLTLTITLPDLPSIGRLQSASAKGKLLCNGKPYKDAKIKLYDIDLTDIDDLMGETKSMEDGTFLVVGNETEITQIDPKINIYHNCEDENVVRTEYIKRVFFRNVFENFK